MHTNVNDSVEPRAAMSTLFLIDIGILNMQIKQVPQFFNSFEIIEEIELDT